MKCAFRHEILSVFSSRLIPIRPQFRVSKTRNLTSFFKHSRTLCTHTSTVFQDESIQETEQDDSVQKEVEKQQLLLLRLRTLTRTQAFINSVKHTAPNLSTSDITSSSKTFLNAVKEAAVEIPTALKEKIQLEETASIADIDNNSIVAEQLLDPELLKRFVQFAFARKREAAAVKTPKEAAAPKLKPLSMPKFKIKLPGADLPFEAIKYDPDLQIMADLTEPHEWYPLARNMKREIVLHVGPTNSGKTYNAIKRLMEAESGVFCAPLRLLAAEVFEKLKKEGVPCDLMTGQEKITIPGSQHTSSTVEMADVSREIEVAVIDETQLIGDRDRGAAWTRVLLGLPAKEIHLCGSANMVDLVAEMCLITGDTFKVNTYKRLTPLKMVPSLKGWHEIQAGDCLIGFSRKQLYSMKKEIETQTGKKCCIIYGSLPPEIRREQAKLFNDPESGYDVLVASDAIGMGLNLNVKRVIFSTVEKFDGTEERTLLPTEALQIAGRAGRFGLHPEGSYTTLFPEDAATLKKQIKKHVPRVFRAGLFPTVEQIETFAEYRPDIKFSSLLQYYAHYATLDDIYFVSTENTAIAIAHCIEDITLTPRERYSFCMAPVNHGKIQHMKLLRRMAYDYSKKGCVMLALQVPTTVPRNSKDLSELELLFTCFELYLWLGLRFQSHIFPDLELAEEKRHQLLELIEKGLSRISEPVANKRMRNRKKVNKRKTRVVNK